MPSHDSTQVSNIYEQEARTAITTVLYDVIRPEGLLSDVAIRQSPQNRKLTNPDILFRTADQLESNNFQAAWNACGNRGSGSAFAQLGQNPSSLECEYLGHTDILMIEPKALTARLLQHKRIEVLKHKPSLPPILNPFRASAPDLIDRIDPTGAPIPTSTGDLRDSPNLTDTKPHPLIKKLCSSDTCPPEATQYVLGEVTADAGKLEKKLCQLERICTYKIIEHNVRESTERTALDLIALAILASTSTPSGRLYNFLKRNEASLPNLAALNKIGRLVLMEHKDSLAETIHQIRVDVEEVMKRSGHERSIKL
ncbi:hypothetical protein HK097_001732 [Rhizophlyctis rosea]|uniref:Uncharacterized protein n=1 Tax=Rhizophlyctis rosea TaxID=64517 RepID=A0AAD5S6B0_9FUNG|nr:hypothetical protein HK097_001732 [Rhizophlyctis rosea]